MIDNNKNEVVEQIPGQLTAEEAIKQAEKEVGLGRVYESQRDYIKTVEGDKMADKIERLIQLHRNASIENKFNSLNQIESIKRAFEIVIKNIEIINDNSRTYVENAEKTIADDLNNLTSENTRLTDEVSRYDLDLENATTELNQAKADLENTTLELTTTKTDLVKATTEKEIAEKRANELNDKYLNVLEENKINIGALEELKNEYQATKENLNTTINENINKVKELEFRLEAKGESLKSKEDRIEELKEDIQDLRRENSKLTNLVGENALIVKEIQNVKAENEEYKKKIAELEKVNKNKELTKKEPKK